MWYGPWPAERPNPAIEWPNPTAEPPIPAADSLDRAVSQNPADLWLVRLTPDALALIAQGGQLPVTAVRGWPHRDTLPLLWTAWQAGGPAWLVTASLATPPGQAWAGPGATPPTSAGLMGTGPSTAGPLHPGVVVGECAVKGPVSRCAPAEIGYGLAPVARGRGYGRMMVSELAATLLAAGAPEIWARTDAANVASRRVLARAGFRSTRASQDASQEASQDANPHASQDASTVCYVLLAGTNRGGSPGSRPTTTTRIAGDAHTTGIAGDHPTTEIAGDHPTTGIEVEHPAVPLHRPDIA